LTAETIRCSVSLYPVNTDYLKRIRPHVFGYELLRCGQVISGDCQVLSLIPAFEATAIPMEDGWRILGNRMIELLEILGEVGQSCTAELPAEAILHRTVKLYLGMATSFLIFRGAYEPGYGKCANRLATLSTTSDISKWPFPHPMSFVDRVRRCTQLKVERSALWEDSVEELLRCALVDLRSLWRWELQELTRRHPATPDGELMSAWMSMQPLWERTRSWVALLRRYGWGRGIKQWPRWARCMLSGSPRYLIYEATRRVLFGDTDFISRMHPSATETDLDHVRRLLPDIHNGRNHSGTTTQSPFQTLIFEIAWNYHQFLETTRA